MSALLLYFILLAFFLLLAVFFSGSETAFLTLNRLRLKLLADAGDKQAGAISKVIAHPDRLLGVILLGSTISNVAAASLVTYMVTTYLPRDQAEAGSLIATVVLTLVVFIFCELTPKIIAATAAEQVARRLLLPTRFAVRILFPFARLAASIANGILRLLGFAPAGNPFIHALSEEEIRAIIAGTTAESMAEQKKEMLSNVLDIGATRVRTVMIPRGEVTAIEIDDPLSEILGVIAATHYSRIPVYRKSFDNVVGILYVKDLLQHIQKPGEINLQVLLRPVHFVPDTAPLDLVLRQLQSMHLHMAVVVDEFGGVEGIVTLEDLLEEIVGEIRDEHDTEVELVRELGPNLYSLAGNLPVKDFNRIFDVKIPEAPQYTTVVGFLEARTGRLLKEGETVRYHNMVFSIEKVEGFRIVSVRVRTPSVRQLAI